MAYSDPALALQKAIVAALKGDPAVSAIVNGRIYDGVPANATKPFISFGLFQQLPEHGACLDGGESFITLDGWCVGPDTVQIKQLGAAICQTLDEAELVVDGQHLVELTIEQTQYLRDPDGITAHASITLRTMTDPL